MCRTWQFVPLVMLALAAACGGGEAPMEPAVPAAQPAGTEAAPPPAGDGLARVAGLSPAASGMVRSIVVLDPHAELDLPVSDERPVIDQFGRQFVPTFLMVQAGQTIVFTNSEDDLHTVHVKDEDGESLINVATIHGSRYDFLVERPGAYTVVCNTHTEMFADILAFDTPYFVMADEDGRFALPDVVPGAYTATVIHGTEHTEHQVEIAAGANELNLSG